MFRKKSTLPHWQEKIQCALNNTNDLISELGKHTENLNNTLTNIQTLFDAIRNIPSEKIHQYEELKKIRLNWVQQARTIERDYNEAVVKNTGVGMAGAGLGGAVVAMGPTVAMGVATTFGTASTGTAIATLHGVAAYNAALAWLGGGTLAAGGGGIAAGEAFLALAGPVGWAIAGVSIGASGLFIWKNKYNQKRIDNIFKAISERDIKSYELAMIELNERISRIVDENMKLNEAIDEIKTMGLNYSEMNEQQQYMLGAYVNLMYASTQLMINPIKGLLPNFSLEDFDEFQAWKYSETKEEIPEEYKDVIVYLANLIYMIELSEKDKNLLCKALRKNKTLLKYINISKKQLDMHVVKFSEDALNYIYSKVDIG